MLLHNSPLSSVIKKHRSIIKKYKSSLTQNYKSPIAKNHKKIGLSFLSLFLYAQASVADTGKLRLELVDAINQRSIAHGTITVTPRRGERQTLKADHKGIAALNHLPAGLYEVEVQHGGYQTLRLPRVRINDNKTTPITLSLVAIKSAVEETLVIGSAITGDRLQSAGTSQMDREALRSAAGSGSDVLRALDGLPGLFSDGEYSSYSVRGNGPRDNLILVDGIPFENVVHFSDSYGAQEEIEGGGRYSVFAPNVVSSAQFQPGGWSSAYGGRAGSLLELEVAEGNPETASYTARLDIAGLEIGYDGPTGLQDTALFFSARQLNFGRLFEAIDMNGVGTPKLTDVIIKTTSSLNDSNQLNLLVIYAPEEYRRDIDNVLASDPDETGNNKNYEDINLIYKKADNTLVAATWSHLMGDSAELTHQVYYRYYSERATSGEAYPDFVAPGSPASAIPQRPEIITSHREETELGLHLLLAADNAIGRLTTGAQINQLDLDFGLALDDNWIRYSYHQNDYRPDTTQKYIELTPALVNNRFSDSATHYALFADQEWQWGNVDFRAGSRYERDNFSEENLLSPRVAATWHAGSKLQITTTGGRYFQTPRFNDRASDASNQQLKNEVIDQVSLGLQYKLNADIAVFIEPYYQDLSRLIVEQDGVSQTLNNTGEGKSYGVDTAISRHFAEGWSANMTYSFNHAQIKDAPDQAFYDADFNRPHSASLGGVWEINSRWKLSGRWKWASGKPTHAFIVNDNVLGDGKPLRYSQEFTTTNTERFDAYSSLNFRVDYQRTIRGIDLIAFFDVINALGADNPNNSYFNSRTGKETTADGSPIPLMGFLLEW